MNSNYVEDGVVNCTNNTTVDGKKNIFLIGDSIRQGYCTFVKTMLEGKANVYFPNENCRNTQNILTSLASWENITNFLSVDLVCFNAGHWDIAHWEGDPDSLTQIDEYAKNIGRIIERLKLCFPNAKICFLTTSPMNPNGSIGRNPRTNEEIREYNAAATKVARSKKIPVLDVFDLMKDKDESYFVDYAHFSKEGYIIIAKNIVEYMEELKIFV